MQLIGIYIDNACQEVRKSLKEKWYTFGVFPLIDISLLEQNNEQEIAKNILNAIADNKEFINELYRLDNSPELTINLNCIVGKNGSGKSTILDLLYRILNNFGVMIKGIYKDLNIDYEPIWATGLNARLYFESSGDDGKRHLVCIKLLGDLKTSYSYDEAPNYLDVIVDGNPIEKKDTTPLKSFFQYFPYTIATNYSLYAGKDDTNEDLRWIDRLYNKNDGYITPIVFAPYKNKNNIDVGKENYIGKERVMYLSLLMQSISDNNHFLENYIPSKIVCNLKLPQYYRSLKNDKVYDYFSGLREKLAASYQDDFEIANLKNKLRRQFSKAGKDKREKEKLKYINTITRNIFFIFMYLYKKWKEYLISSSTTKLLDDYILPYLAYKTIKICLQYESFKTLFDNRDLYDSWYRNRKKTQLILDKVIIKLNPYYDDKDNKCSTFCLKKRDHINLKIYQCIRFYENHKEKELSELEYLEVPASDFLDNTLKSFAIERNIDKKELKLSYDDIVEYAFPSFFEKKMYYSRISNNQNTTKDLSSNEILLTQMSSGEQHLYFSLSYAIYHIKNIESVIEGERRVKYRNINLIFDEAELYYHPEYQRNYIQNLLTVLSNSNLDPKLINSINITLITHSPYLISDIPSNCILALDNGSIKNEQQKSFCANYYDLLKNHFFLSSTIGGIAEKNINKIIESFKISKRLRESSESISIQDEKKLEAYKNTEKYYKQLIDAIGDEYLHKILLSQHNYIIEQNRLLEEAYEKINGMTSDELKQFLGNTNA